jgi:dienelactone hydrolase
MHLLDMLFGMAARGPRFFVGGWGDRALVEAFDAGPELRRRPDRIQVRLSPPARALGGLLHEGTFGSPEPRLPECARRARIRLLLPRGETRGVAVHLAASGDQGFAVRLRYAAPLLADGIGTCVLENAFYGARRPPYQRGHAIHSVSDLYLMGSATFREGRALLRWLREAREVPHVGVTGFSMGGQMAAMVGASMPWPVACVPMAPSCSPDSVIRDGVLRRVADVAALAAAGADAEAAREELCAVLARFTVLDLPAPVLPEAAIVVGTRADGVVPPADQERIARHWGAELRWLDAGHVTAVLRFRDEMRAALRDAFARLRAHAAAAHAARTRRRGARRSRAHARRAPAGPGAVPGRAAASLDRSG